MTWRSFKQRVTPEVSRQLEEEAERLAWLRLQLGLAFREAQEEAFAEYVDREKAIDDVGGTVRTVRAGERPGGRRRGWRMRRLVQVATWTFVIITGVEVARAAVPFLWEQLMKLWTGQVVSTVTFRYPLRPDAVGCQTVDSQANVVALQLEGPDLMGVDQSQILVTLTEMWSEKPTQIVWDATPEGVLTVRVNRALLSLPCDRPWPADEMLAVVMPRMRGLPRCGYHLTLSRKDNRLSQSYPFVFADDGGKLEVCYVGYGSGGGAGDWPRVYQTPAPTRLLPTQ